MREVAGHDAQLGIPMMAIDVVDARLEAFMGIEPVQQFAARHQVRVGEVDEFHGVLRGRESVPSSCSATESAEFEKGSYNATVCVILFDCPGLKG